MPPKRKAQKKKESRPPSPKSEEPPEEVKPDLGFLHAISAMDSVAVGSHTLNNVLEKVDASITDKWARAELPSHNSKRESVVQ